MSSFSWDSIIKYHRMGVLNNRNLLDHSFGSWKPWIKVPTWLVSGEDFLPGLHIAASLLCPPLTSSFFEQREIEREKEIFGVSSYQDTNPILRDLSSQHYLTLITSQKPNLQILSHWGLGLWHMDLEQQKRSVNNRWSGESREWKEESLSHHAGDRRRANRA